jgi:hypothetical protein
MNRSFSVHRSYCVHIPLTVCSAFVCRSQSVRSAFTKRLFTARLAFVHRSFGKVHVERLRDCKWRSTCSFLLCYAMLSFTVSEKMGKNVSFSTLYLMTESESITYINFKSNTLVVKSLKALKIENLKLLFERTRN